MPSTDRIDRQKFQTQEYWESRFKSEQNQDSLQENSTHEWFASYQTFRQPLLTNLKKLTSHKSLSNISNILVVGCGNSTLSFELLNDFPNAIIHSSDFSPSVIEAMTEKYKEHSDRLKWIVQDLTKLDDEDQKHHHNKYDLIIEKGVLDALVAGSRSPWPSHMDQNCKCMVQDACNGITKLLKKDTGVFISISFASQMFRTPLLLGKNNDKEFSWKVSVVDFINQNGTGFEYYIYFCDRDVERSQGLDVWEDCRPNGDDAIENNPIEIPENDIFCIDF